MRSNESCDASRVSRVACETGQALFSVMKRTDEARQHSADNLAVVVETFPVFTIHIPEIPRE
jgi:hypothetical protein